MNGKLTISGALAALAAMAFNKYGISTEELQTFFGQVQDWISQGVVLAATGVAIYGRIRAGIRHAKELAAVKAQVPAPPVPVTNVVELHKPGQDVQ